MMKLYCCHVECLNNQGFSISVVVSGLETEREAHDKALEVMIDLNLSETHELTKVHELKLEN